MGFHHVAIATRDIKATHEFYSGPMGFRLQKVVAGPTPEGGWAKHVFYDTGDGTMIAFWDLHDASLPADYPTAIAEGLGLPIWTNHIAFDATTLADLEARKRRWLEHGVDVMEVDHGWCTSIYAKDPNGVMVEFCTTTRRLGESDAREATALLSDPSPPLETPPQPRFHPAKR